MLNFNNVVSGSSSARMHNDLALQNVANTKVDLQAALDPMITSASKNFVSGTTASSHTTALVGLRDNYDQIPKDKDGYITKQGLQKVVDNPKDFPPSAVAAARYFLDPAHVDQLNALDTSREKCAEGKVNLDGKYSREDIESELSHPDLVDVRPSVSEQAAGQAGVQVAEQVAQGAAKAAGDAQVKAAAGQAGVQVAEQVAQGAAKAAGDAQVKAAAGQAGAQVAEQVAQGAAKAAGDAQAKAAEDAKTKAAGDAQATAAADVQAKDAANAQAKDAADAQAKAVADAQAKASADAQAKAAADAQAKEKSDADAAAAPDKQKPGRMSDDSGSDTGITMV